MHNHIIKQFGINKCQAVVEIEIVLTATAPPPCFGVSNRYTVVLKCMSLCVVFYAFCYLTAGVFFVLGVMGVCALALSGAHRKNIHTSILPNTPQVGNRFLLPHKSTHVGVFLC